MYRLLLIKRIIEDTIIFPFIQTGKLIARLYPQKKEYRIFFFFPFYHTGGAEKVHAQIAKAAGGKDCIIFFTRKSGDIRFLSAFKGSDCDIKDISKFTDNKWLYFLNLIYRGVIIGYINKQQVSPVVFNGQCNFGYKISPWIRKNIAQVELIHSLNTFSYIRIPFLPFITKTIMISQNRIEDHKALYKKFKIPSPLEDRIIYIPNAISLPVIEILKDKNDFIVLFTGRNSSEKRIPLFIQIAETLHQKDKTIKFEIAGDVTGTDKTSDLPYIRFYGNIFSEEQLNKLYAKAHVLLLVSTTEGFPVVIMEAMTHGCTILATPVGDIPLHVWDNETGFLFSTVQDEAKIIKEATEKILWLKKNPAEFEKISSACVKYAKQNFGIERFNKDYRELLASVKQEN